MSVFIQYRLTALEPLRIADLSRSQSGQALTLNYIPGSAVRGCLVNALAQEGSLEQVKKELFSAEVRFGNAYLSVRTKNGTWENLLPSPKGFYEDKSPEDAEKGKELDNVVISGEFNGGYKRAGLGSYAEFRSDTIHYYSVETSADLKIRSNVVRNEDRNIFRNEYLMPGTSFAGQIAVPDQNLAERLRNFIKDTLHGEVLLGNARSSGYGKCKVEELEIESRPMYAEYEADRDLQGECYLYLISNTVMRDELGQYCGLNLKALGDALGVKIHEDDLLCAASVVTVYGYNRTYGGRIPSMNMYQAGSVFHLHFDGVMKTDRIHALLEQGIGVRRNEGFGQAMILQDYEGLKSKKKGTVSSAGHKASAESKEDKEICRMIASVWLQRTIEKAMLRYTVTHPLNRKEASVSQLGTLEAYTLGYRNDPLDAEEKLMKYIRHAQQKAGKNNVHREKSSLGRLGQDVLNLLSLDTTSFEKKLELPAAITEMKEIMGVPVGEVASKERLMGWKLDLITMLIRYDNKTDRSENTARTPALERKGED